MIWFFLALLKTAWAAEAFHLTNVYSRGNDDLQELNYETATVTLELRVQELPPSKWFAELAYRAVFSTDHPHNPMGDRYHLKQRVNDIEPNLSAVKFIYTPGPTGNSLGGTITGTIFLGEFSKNKTGPLRGRIAVTMEPDFDPSVLLPVDSTIDWGFLMQDGAPQLGELSLHAQWKGTTRPSDEMLRLIASNFVNKSSFRPPFQGQTTWSTSKGSVTPFGPFEITS